MNHIFDILAYLFIHHPTEEEQRIGYIKYLEFSSKYKHYIEYQHSDCDCIICREGLK